jgi:hypothetical protein
MSTRSSTTLVILFLLAAFGATACSSTGDPEEELTGESSQALGRVIATNNLLEDANIEGDQHVTVAQVQSFLATHGSALSGYSAGGRTAAQWIVEESRAQEISPVYMLARLETESGIVRSGTLSKLSQATGCGCPDGSVCDPQFANFGLQVRCAAQLMRGYFKSLATSGQTITGWRVGVGRSTSDPCWVTPANKATAALYTYTPWVGAYGIGCGTAMWGGSSLVAGLYKTFRPSFGQATTPNGDCALGDGRYCGGNGVTGDATALYRCTAGIAAVARSCALGCRRMPAGQNDVCAEGAACPYGNGAYCGGNGIGGAPETLYDCSGGHIAPKTACANGCRPMPIGQADVCR